MPIHDDPCEFGRIVAANRLSDVWAMGGRPIMALNVCGFPQYDLPLELLAAMLRGGAEKAAEAGVPIAGGHTLNNPEPFYGLAVVGLVDPARIVTNTGANPGDQLVLTKALGTGVIMTAMMNDQADARSVSAATRSMTILNRTAAEVMLRQGVHAATDVTGFGLIGHAHALAAGSGLALRFWLSRLPLLAGSACVRGMRHRHQGRPVKPRLPRGLGGPSVAAEAQIAIICDPQTSGGLLMAFPPERLEGSACRPEVRSGVHAAHVGEALEGRGGHLEFAKTARRNRKVIGVAP